MKFNLSGKVLGEPVSVEKTQIDLILELIAAFLVLISVILSVYFYFRLPEQIATHFNISFEPDATGSRSNLFILDGVMVLGVLLTLLSARYPKLINVPVKINPEKALAQRLCLCRMARVLSVWFGILFLMIILAVGSPVLGCKYTVWQIPVFFCMAGIILTIVYARFKARKMGK